GGGGGGEAGGGGGGRGRGGGGGWGGGGSFWAPPFGQFFSCPLLAFGGLVRATLCAFPFLSPPPRREPFEIAHARSALRKEEMEGVRPDPLGGDLAVAAGMCASSVGERMARIRKPPMMPRACLAVRSLPNRQAMDDLSAGLP